MSQLERKNEGKQRSHIPFRMNLLFFIIFLLFAGLIVQLGYMQIIRADDYQAEVDRTESTVIRGSVPRGEIYDAHHKKLVGNEAKNAILYTRGKNTSVESMAQVAYKLADLIEIDHQSFFENEEKPDVSERDLRDYYYAMHGDEMKKRVEAHLDEQNINANDFTYNDELQLISEEELRQLDDRHIEAAAIFHKMNEAYALSTITIKNEDVSEDEMATVAEHLALLPGVSTGTDWERVYPEGDMIRSILGNVSSEVQGLPESDLNAYLAKGYSRNDRVGTSFIEQEYEEVLAGTKSRLETETDQDGDIIDQVEQYQGEKGHNLVLTIDTEFQEQVEQITVQMLNRGAGLNDSAYIVALNPNNGDVLALSGKKRDENGEIQDDALGTFSKAFTMGSSVKAATVMAGYMDGVLSPDNNVMVDEPLQFVGSENISSVWHQYDSAEINDITAIYESSNVYMSKIAMRMGGYWDFVQNQTIPIDAQEVVNKERYYFKQFGLGSPTGIDLPSESTGQEGQVDNAGQPLFNAFGQFDTYTPLQLAQYALTVANGGTRFAPRVVKEIRGTNSETGELGELKATIEPKIMNTVDVSDEVVGRVHEGMQLVNTGERSSASNFFSNAPYDSAGKTGTAEAYYWGDNEAMRGTPVINHSYIAFAPLDDPQIAIAVVLPYLPTDRQSGNPHLEAGRKVLDAYFASGAENEDEE